MSKPPRRTAADVAAAHAPDALLRRERDLYKAELRALEGEMLVLRERLDLLERLEAPRDAAPWVSRVRKGAVHTGIPTLLLSDCHFDEVVRPDEVEGVNAYNRAIAVRRLHRTLERVTMLTRTHISGLKYEGFVLMLGGDLLSGAIHEELEQTNEDTVYGSLDFWADQLAGFILGLVAQFGKVQTFGVVGNHGRRTRMPRAKLRARDNLDWLLYKMLARATKGEKVHWCIAEAADIDAQVYDTRYRLTHGDQFRGGSGISGMLAPLMLGRHRKAQRQMALARPFSWLVMGHWHEYLHGRGLIVNGSLKGLDEYAYVNNFACDPPTQAFWITTPEHGASLAAPIFPMDRKAEGW